MNSDNIAQCNTLKQLLYSHLNWNYKQNFVSAAKNLIKEFSVFQAKDSLLFLL